MPMDSFNSSGGSMESSSGGGDDEEYTSRPALAGAGPGPGQLAFSSFLVNSNAHQQLFRHHHDNTAPPPLPVFEALPNFFDQLTRPGPPDRNHQPHFQLGVGVGGDELGVMLPPSARSPSANLMSALQLSADLGYCPGQSQTMAGSTGGVMNPSFTLVSDPPKPAEDRPKGRNNNSNGMPPRRNPKKRTRASRRAPTTVLTTDTSNFRAMVQEFTGIPTPPFDAAVSLFQRGRFDLFGPSFSGNATSTGSLIPPSSPSYLLRPFAQRLLQASPLPPTSLFISSTTSGNNTTSASAELLFPLLSDNNNVNGPNNASPSMLNFGQTLVKYSSNHDHERAQERLPQGNLGPGGINNVHEEFRFVRHGDQDRDRDFTVSPSSTQNVAIPNRSEGGMPMESWICSSD